MNHKTIRKTAGAQLPQYYTEREGGVYGTGRFSVITVKNAADDADSKQMTDLPDIGGLTTLSPLLLPAKLNSDADLRPAAARLKAGMILLYTFETSFHTNDNSVALSNLRGFLN